MSTYLIWDALSDPVRAFITSRLNEIQSPTPCPDGAGDWVNRLRLMQLNDLNRKLDTVRPELTRSNYDGAEIDARLDALRNACLQLAHADDGPPQDARERWERLGAQVQEALLVLRPIAVAAGGECITNPGDEDAWPAHHGHAASTDVEAPTNKIMLVGGVWHIIYGKEKGDFLGREDSAFRHLARLLAQPNRRLRYEDFFPPPPGAAPLPYMGRDAASDKTALSADEQALRRLAQEIKEASEAGDSETIEELRRQFEELTKHYESERPGKGGRKKRVGSLSPQEGALQSVRVGLSRIYERLCENGLPELGRHLDSSITFANAGFIYAPPPGTPPWHVHVPSRINSDR
jgi:hypothetical protein